MTNTFNSANQLTGNGTDSFEYDANGNLWKTNSVVSHTWDRANRLLLHGGLDYAYDGLGNRISQDNGTDVTSYLLDLQSSLPRVLSETVGANVTRFVHSLRGLHATQNPADAWFYSLQDGLGSQRAEISTNKAVVGSQDFTPYGVVQNVTGTFNSPHAFTGEQRDLTGIQYHRARYMNPALGGFLSLDPLEGVYSIPMSLNRYSWVEGNPTTNTDPSGLIPSRDSVEDWTLQPSPKGAEYTQNCGWVDWPHVINSETRSFTLIDDIQSISDFGKTRSFNLIGDFENLNNFNKRKEIELWAVRISLQLGLGPLEYNLFNNAAIIRDDAISNENVLPLAVSIFMDANEKFEIEQGNLGANQPGSFRIAAVLQKEKLGSSRFSEEDLPSNIIGFYVASERLKRNVPSATVYQEVRNMCGSVNEGSDSSNSVLIYKQAYGNGTKFTTGWKQWRPKFVSLVNNGCLSEICDNHSPVFPSEFSSLTNMRINPQRDGIWWWHDPFQDGQYLWDVPELNRPNVFELPVYD